MAEQFEYWTDFRRNPFMWIVGKPKIGKNVWIGPFTVLDGSGGLTIGDNCMIGAGAQIYTHENKSRSETKRIPTKIGDGVFICAGAIVMMGCTIEEGATIGAGAVLLKESHVKAGEMWVGVPAKRHTSGANVR
jgi:acetyltransferase-like isoleucine patch superfamily enzyme